MIMKTILRYIVKYKNPSCISEMFIFFFLFFSVTLGFKLCVIDCKVW